MRLVFENSPHDIKFAKVLGGGPFKLDLNINVTLVPGRI